MSTFGSDNSSGVGRGTRHVIIWLMLIALVLVSVLTVVRAFSVSIMHIQMPLSLVGFIPIAIFIVLIIIVSRLITAKDGSRK